MLPTKRLDRLLIPRLLGTKSEKFLYLFNCRLRDVMLAAILFLAAPVWAGEVEVGGKALATGDYQTAYNEFRPLAERGNPSAQFNLGVMYAVGHGVKKNLSEAVKWFTLAADQGYNNAQRNLGSMYILGQGVEQDFVKGYLWADLSAAQGDKESALLRDTLEKEMTADQINQARKLVSEWKASRN